MVSPVAGNVTPPSNPASELAASAPAPVSEKSNTTPVVEPYVALSTELSSVTLQTDQTEENIDEPSATPETISTPPSVGKVVAAAVVKASTHVVTVLLPDGAKVTVTVPMTARGSDVELVFLPMVSFSFLL